jgi:hypothetical protein
MTITLSEERKMAMEKKVREWIDEFDPDLTGFAPDLTGFAWKPLDVRPAERITMPVFEFADASLDGCCCTSAELAESLGAPDAELDRLQGEVPCVARSFVAPPTPAPSAWATAWAGFGADQRLALQMLGAGGEVPCVERSFTDRVLAIDVPDDHIDPRFVAASPEFGVMSHEEWLHRWLRPSPDDVEPVAVIPLAPPAPAWVAGLANDDRPRRTAPLACCAPMSFDEECCGYPC